MSDSFAELRASGPIDLAIMSIGAYNPWIHSHCTSEQAVQMANEAGAHFIMPVHHQTFRLSSEGFREPIERFQAALYKTPERIALRAPPHRFRSRHHRDLCRQPPQANRALRAGFMLENQKDGHAGPSRISLQTQKLERVLGPNVVATSAASRPRASNTLPIRGTLLRASNVYHCPPR